MDNMDPKVTHRSTPHTKPPFTYADIKSAVPPHCFHRSIFRSFSYLAFDIMLAYFFHNMATAYMITKPESFSSGLIYLVNWSVYALVQGCVFGAFWFIGHECGHHAFTDYQWLDDTVGFIMHSFILWPYFSFKTTHRRHHGKTGHLSQEEVETPMLKSEVPQAFKYIDNTIGRLIAGAFLLFSGAPLYLLVNFRGRNYDRYASHLDPTSPMFSRGQRNSILLSNAGILTVVFAIYKVALIKGTHWVGFVYGGPCLVAAAIVTGFTTLQHVDATVPYYDSTEWDWLKGSLATIDRDFGLVNDMFHQAPNTHVAHHLFPSIPHYHAAEATRALKPVLGEYYHFDDTPLYKAFWNILKHCNYVEEDEGDKSKGVYWYKSISEYQFK